MSAPTMTRSAYPVPVDELLPKARDLAARLGGIPSRNRLMTEFSIGAPKATALRAALLRDESGDAPAKDARPGRLHLVTPEPDAPGPIAEPDSAPVAKPDSAPEPGAAASEPDGPAPVVAPPVPSLASDATDPGTPAPLPRTRPARSWPVLLLAAPAFVAIWSGWVGLGGLTGFGTVRPLPGIWDSLELNTAITLPIGVETYAAYAIRAWLSPLVPRRARRFAKWSAIGSLTLGAAGQVAYHLMTAAHVDHAPWQITTLVACLAVAVLGMGAALAHLLRHPDQPDRSGR